MDVLNALVTIGAFLLWIASMASLSDLHGSDAAGNGLAAAFGVFASIGLWIALLILLVFSASRGGWPNWTKWVGFLLFPACTAASFVTFKFQDHLIWGASARMLKQILAKISS